MTQPLHELSPLHARERDQSAVAEIPLLRLDWAWLYTPGTVCNLACRHCLTLSSPSSTILQPLETAEVEAAMEEIKAVVGGAYPVSIGMTGGEVFLLDRERYQRRLFDQVACCLEVGDVLILTNALLATPENLSRLKKIEEAAPHSLGFRISIDGATAAENDAIRTGLGGSPTFDKIVAALPLFVDAGFRPTIAYTYSNEGGKDAVGDALAVADARYQAMLEKAGTPGLELWGIPIFDQGEEFKRREEEGLEHIQSPGITNDCIARYTQNAFHDFQCSYSRAFAKEPDGSTGWYKCAVLPAEGIEPGSRIATSLAASMGDITLPHTQCITCFRAATQGCAMSCSGP